MSLYLRNYINILFMNRAYIVILKYMKEMCAMFFKTLKQLHLLLLKFTKTSIFPPSTQNHFHNNAGLMFLQVKTKSQFLIRSKRTLRKMCISSRYHRLLTQIFHSYEFYYGSHLCFYSHLSS